MARWPFLLLLVLPAAGRAADVSTTPYIALYSVLEPARTIRAFDHLVVNERIESKSPGVRPQDIHITIRAKRGAIVVPIGADGTVDFPIEDALRDENPPVETNQPKGSLALSVLPGLRLPAGLTMSGADLAAAMKQTDELFAKAPPGSPPPVLRGIIVEFDAGAPASVTLAGKGESLLKADAGGRVIVMRDLLRESEKPSLVFSRRPAGLQPYLGE